jgi:hypothetical protein
MIDTTILQRNSPPIRYEAATHLFTTGQIVRLKVGLGCNLNPRTLTASLRCSHREEIHNNIASGTRPNITNGWRRRTVLKQ